jgi:hypothetical protein
MKKEKSFIEKQRSEMTRLFGSNKDEHKKIQLKIVKD